jgi:hypothetical protein
MAPEENARDRLHGIGGEIAFAVFPGPDAEGLQQMDRRLLHDDLVEHHSAAPHPAADAQLPLEQGHLFPGPGQKIARHQARRPPADDGDIHFEHVGQLFVKPVDDGPRDGDFVEFHVSSLRCAVSGVIEKESAGIPALVRRCPARR